MTLLSSFSHSRILNFIKDLNRLLDMFGELDSEFGQAREDFQYNKPICEEYMKSFDNKYAGLRVAYDKTGQKLTLHIMLNEKDMIKVFDDALSRIQGIASVGLTDFDQVSVTDADALKNVLESVKKSLYVKYEGYESNTVMLNFNPVHKLVEISLYSGEKIHEESPEFILMCYYALSKGGDSTLNLREISNKFCYSIHGASGRDQNPGYFN